MILPSLPTRGAWIEISCSCCTAHPVLVAVIDAGFDTGNVTFDGYLHNDDAMHLSAASAEP